MSADDLPELPPDAREALAHGKKVEGPSDAVRARMRARLVSALPSPPGGDGSDGGGAGEAAPPAGGGGGAGALGALPKVPVWVAALALVAGGAAGLLYPRTPIERVVVMHGPPLALSVSAPPLPVAVSSAPPSVPSIDMKDLPLVPVVAPGAAPARGDDLAAERAALDVARTALGRGDGANALAACDDHAKRYPRGALAEEREAIAVQALVLEHRGEEARARAERFRKTHPRSILLPAVLAAAGIEP